MSESRAFCQSRPSVDRPSARSRVALLGQQVEQGLVLGPDLGLERAGAASAARAGLWPPVDTATMSGPRRTTDGQGERAVGGVVGAVDPDARPPRRRRTRRR